MRLIKLLCLVLVTTLFTTALYITPLSANTEPTPDTSWYYGNEDEETFTIYTADQLAGLAELVNGGNAFDLKTIMLGNDIDLSEYGKNWNNGQGWIPIGVEIFYYGPHIRMRPFYGIFDGNNHAITGLYIYYDTPTLSSNASFLGVGLFGYCPANISNDSPSIKNLSVIDANITALDRVTADGIVGKITGTGVGLSNCYVTGEVKGSYNVGGVVGTASGHSIGGPVIIKNCYSGVVVSGISNPYHATAEVGPLGGVVGSMQAIQMVNCYSAGSISGGNYVGGIAGEINGLDSNVTNCYTTSTVNSIATGGGIAGYINSSDTVVIVNNCVALNPYISGGGIGRIALNRSHLDLLSNNRALSDMIVKRNDMDKELIKGHDQVDGEDVTMEEAKTAAFWTETMGWDDEVWLFEDGKLPTLRDVPEKDIFDGLITTTSKAVRINGNIVLTVDTDVEIPDDNFIHIALYDEQNKLVDYILIPIITEDKTLGHFYVVFKDNANADYVKVFIWKQSMNSVSIADKIPISTIE